MDINLLMQHILAFDAMSRKQDYQLVCAVVENTWVLLCIHEYPVFRFLIMVFLAQEFVMNVIRNLFVKLHLQHILNPTLIFYSS